MDGILYYIRYVLLFVVIVFVIIEEESEESSEESDEVDEDGYVVYSAQKVRHNWSLYVSLVYNLINTSGDGW